MLIYKILTNSEWEEAKQLEYYEGSVLDRKDGFIHLSSREQLAETLAIHFKNQLGLRVLSYSTEDMEELKWESSRGGQLFPHLYARLPMKAYQSVCILEVNAEGIPLPPWETAETKL